MDRRLAERSVRLGVLLGLWVVVLFTLVFGIAWIATG
jgi:hypothetical protein